jgi:hypothetical protein
VNRLVEARDEDRSEVIRLERELRESHNHNARLIHFIVNQSHIDMTFFDHYVKSHHPPGSRYALPRASVPTTVVTNAPTSPPSHQKRGNLNVPKPLISLKRRRLIDAATPAPQRTETGSADDIDSDDDYDDDGDIGTAAPPPLPASSMTVC